MDIYGNMVMPFHEVIHVIITPEYPRNLNIEKCKAP